jgi:CRP-like cAMP-binding protein
MGGLLQELRLIPIFANINPETLESLSKLLKEERFGQGEYVVREGDHAEAMYIIRSGEVEVRKAIRREPEKYKILAILEKGDIFGEMAVFGEEFRSADVVARNDALLWKMDYSELFNILRSDPAGGVKILQVIITILVTRIKSLNRELTTLYELGQRLQQLNDIEDLTKVVFGLVMSNVEPAEVGLLAILNIFNEEFDIHQSSETIRERHIDYKDPVAVWMFENKTPLIVKDKASDPRFKDTFYSGLSFIASPLLHEERLLGFILLSNLSYQNAFSYSHMILLSTVCAQVGARLNDLERKKEEILKQRLSQGRLTVKI